MLTGTDQFKKHEERLNHLQRQIKLHRDIVEKLIQKNGRIKLEERLKKREIKVNIKESNA